MASGQDPVLSHCVGARDAAHIYDAAPAPKNKVLPGRHAITDYLIKRLCMKPKTQDSTVREDVEAETEKLVNDLEAATDKMADELDSNIKNRDNIIRRLKASLDEKETKTIESNDSNVITDDYDTNEEGEVEPSEDELTNVVHYSESYLDTCDYAKAYDGYHGHKTRNPEKPQSPPSPINPQTNEPNPGPSEGDRIAGQRVGTPIPGPSRPRPDQIKAPDTPSKNKSQVGKPIKKSRPSPIKFPEATDHEEEPNGEDVPLSRLITTPKISRPVARQDL